MKEFLSLNDIKPGKRARVKELTSTGSIRRRLLDIGLVENTEVECLGQSPLVQPCTGFNEQKIMEGCTSL